MLCSSRRPISNCNLSFFELRLEVVVKAKPKSLYISHSVSYLFNSSMHNMQFVLAQSSFKKWKVYNETKIPTVESRVLMYVANSEMNVLLNERC